MARYYLFLISIILVLIISNPIYAQPSTGQFINVSAGFGFSSPDYETEYESEAEATGFYAQAEYVYAPLSWFGVRPYAGIIIASDESALNEKEQYRIQSNAALLGVKARFAAPIPYVAPFVEVGVGVSVGSFETSTIYTSRKASGAIAHIPFTLGLAVGREHNYEIKFTYYFHDSVDQFSGAAAFGFSFPLD